MRNIRLTCPRIGVALLLFSWIANALVTPALAGELGDRVEYVGGTISVLPSKIDGLINTREDDIFIFQTKRFTVQVPYDKINEIEYGQRVGRRYAEAILISPVFLLSKTRKHFLTVGFTDDRGHQQAMIFQVGKNEVRSMLVVLEAKSGRRVEYQDDDARPVRKGLTMLLPLLLMAAGVVEPKPLVPPAAVDQEVLGQLLTVRRVYIDRLTGGETALQMRDMIAASLQGVGLFVITENPDRADAILRGSAEDLVFTDIHSSSDSIHADSHFGFSNGDTTQNNSNSGGVGGMSGHSSSTQRDQRSQNGGMSVGDSESTHSVERRHEAVAAVRLVNKDGDVIWSTTQESLGGKFRGSSADVADKITKKLLEDYERAKKLKK